MNRKDEHAAKGQTNPRSGGDATRKDDLWLSDLKNDLGAFSLSSDDVPAHQLDEMGCMDEAEKPQKPTHEEVGI